MTTVACNRTSLACDLQYSYGNSTKFRGATKAIELTNGKAQLLFKCKKVIIGFAGTADKFAEFVNWCCGTEDNEKPPKLSSIELLALTDEGKIFHGSGPSVWMEIKQPHFAIGSGMEFALGAMETGASPLEAVKIASKHDSKTGMGFKEYFI